MIAKIICRKKSKPFLHIVEPRKKRKVPYSKMNGAEKNFPLALHFVYGSHFDHFVIILWYVLLKRTLRHLENSLKTLTFV